MVRLASSLFFAMSLVFGSAVITGCDNKEEVLEVETQEGEMEVEENTETGELDVETE